MATLLERSVGDVRERARRGRGRRRKGRWTVEERRRRGLRGRIEVYRCEEHVDGRADVAVPSASTHVALVAGITHCVNLDSVERRLERKGEADREWASFTLVAIKVNGATQGWTARSDRW
jgi:hypothetical protein